MGLKFNSTWAHRVRAVLRRNAVGGFGRQARAGPPVPPTAEWDEAFLRVESYLRAYQIESRVLLNQLTMNILADARSLAARHPEEPPVTLAIQVAHARIGAWLVQGLGEGDWADERFRARGRLALLMSEIPHRCPEFFLSREELSAETKSRLAEATLRSGPDINLTSMPPAPLEFSLGTAVEERWVTFSRSAFLRASASWLIIAGFLGIAWFASR
jgi:hypothetical protein